MDLKYFISGLENGWKRFNDMMETSLASEVSLLNSINSYLLGHRGKGIRPMLTLLFDDAVGGGCSEDVIRCAAVVEILHTATLLHDDVADNSGMRRGSATVMSCFSPAASVLAGDYWLSKALELLVSMDERKVLREFTSAVQRLAEGEMIQMEKAGTLDTTEEDYMRIISCKTSSLFVAPLKSVAMIDGCTDDQVDMIGRYADRLGKAFQIRDDIFDYSPSMDTGKYSGTDIREHKITLPLLGAIGNDPEGARRIMELMSSGTPDEAAVKEITCFAVDRGGLEYAQKRLVEEVSEAVKSLDFLKPSASKDKLVSMAEYLAVRER